MNGMICGKHLALLHSQGIQCRILWEILQWIPVTCMAMVILYIDFWVI